MGKSKARSSFLIVIGLSLMLPGCGLSSKQRDATRDAIQSLKRIQAATEVGVNYQAYGQLLIDAQAKANDAKSLLPDSELRNRLSEVIGTYKDANQIWTKKIENGNDLLGFMIKDILEKYPIPTQPIKGGSGFLIDADIAIQ